MNIQRFLGPTSREAMSKARAAFGDSAVILSSRATASGFEVVATTEENLSTLPVGASSQAALGQVAASTPSASPRGSFAERARLSGPTNTAPAPAAMPKTFDRNATVSQDTETLAMSTLSFQDYVRERMLKRRKEEQESRAQAAAPQASSLQRRAAAERGMEPSAPQRPSAQAAIKTRDMLADKSADVPRQLRQSAGEDWAASMVMPSAESPLHVQAGGGSNVATELSALKDMIEDRFNMLAWLGTSRNNPLQSNLMLKLIRAGYSPALVRSVLERMPNDASASDAVRWVMDVLARNLKTAESATSICDEGGVVALVGPTGVGKTTTAAKLAAQCVKQYGANSVGLITLDTYRVAGYEQLRAYGRMMGVVAHLAHDRAALKDLLTLLQGKRLVLIDTAGLGQKDPRIQDMMEVLDLPGIKKMLVLNASSHGDTLDDVLTAFKAKDLHGVVLSKVDEAVKLGPAIDALVRHQVVLRGVANGQRVPEDWAGPVAQQLVRTSMGTEGKSAFDPAPSEVGFFFAQSTPKQMNLGALRV